MEKYKKAAAFFIFMADNQLYSTQARDASRIYELHTSTPQDLRIQGCARAFEKVGYTVIIRKVTDLPILDEPSLLTSNARSSGFYDGWRNIGHVLSEATEEFNRETAAQTIEAKVN